MKRNFDAEILDLKGEPYKDAATLGTVAFAACQAPALGDDRLTGAERVRIYQAASRALKGGVQDWTSEDIAFLKERIGKVMHPFVVGRAYEILDTDYVEAGQPS